MDPNLPLTIDRPVWDAVAEAVRPTFADSYLSGALQTGDRVTTHTTIAYDRLMANRWAMDALNKLGIVLVKPLPFGHPARPDTPT